MVFSSHEVVRIQNAAMVDGNATILRCIIKIDQDKTEYHHTYDCTAQLYSTKLDLQVRSLDRFGQ